MQRIKFSLYGFLFRFFSFFADKTGGNIFFVKPKMVLGSLILGLSACSTIQTVADNVQLQSENKNDIKSDANVNSEQVFCYVTEQMPQFPGGEKALMAFIYDNLKYDTIAMCYNGVAGRVVLRFVINEDGSVSDITVARSLDPLLDKEAIRVVELMPKWIPGKQNGEVCKVWYNLPVTFKRFY